MSTSTTTGTLFKPELVREMFSKVKGHSSLAKLCNASPMPFAGSEIFVFSMDGEASIVGEGASKPAGDAAFTPVTIKPIKFVYQHRLTDEFVRTSEEKQLQYLQQFSDGFAKKIARGLDIAGFHGVNPASGSASAIVGTNCFVSAVPSANVIEIDTTSPINPDDAIDEAAQKIVIANGIVNGVAMSPAFGAEIGSMKTQDSNLPIYPEFRFGANPAAFCGLPSDINNTVSFVAANKLKAIVGDFQNAFRWGYAENIPLEIIQYGNPDGLGDLKQTNQIVLRAEAYIGWGILDPASFAIIKDDDE